MSEVSDQTEKQYNPDANPLTFIACIDLPGEDVHCWQPSITQIKVILRKHRDVLFHIQLFQGMIYTVNAEQSDFYDARAKKFVPLGKHVTFHDGERMHLWVSREFKGALVLKANGKVLGRYEPNVLDPARHDAEPATKPAPLMVMMHNEGVRKVPWSKTACKPGDFANFNEPCSSDRVLEAASSVTYPQKTETIHQTGWFMHVIEIDLFGVNIPEKVAEALENGGEETAIDTSGLLTRNWLLAQIVGIATYYHDNRHWINEFWGQKFYIEKVTHAKGVRAYLVFRGDTGLRKYFTSEKYLMTHPRVLAITGGAGSAEGLRHGAWDAAKGTFKKASLFAVIFTILIDTAEWLNDYEQRDPKTGKPKRDFFDLVFRIGIDLVVAGISAALAAVAVGLFVSSRATFTMGAAVVLGAVGASLIFGLTIALLDKLIGATDGLTRLLRDGAHYLENKLPLDYENYQHAIDETTNYEGIGV